MPPCADAGIEVACTNVGDRYVLEELRRKGWALGGEQSGHIIEMGFNSTGDGIAGALLTLEALAGRDLSERDAMRKLPQRLVNVRGARQRRARDAESVAEAVQAEDQRSPVEGECSCAPAAPSRLCESWSRLPPTRRPTRVCIARW